MPRRGSWEMRNAEYKERRAREFAEALTDADRLAVAIDWFRSSLALLARRRVPPNWSQDDNRHAAARLMGEMARDLVAQARAIDEGKYDAGRT